ncbi:hypothetical protein CASFOL_034821 [Castilleja foliolosa]|uniref:Uncharacterized protein n=1 Tax=Castilleja foliolosa TaxID=1961234 RepID=A0ABD3BRU5_9LAMI
MSSFGMEDFAKKYGTLKPSQFVDMISLVGDKSDNIPGAMLRSDLPSYMVPFTTNDLTFIKPEDNSEEFTSLLTAISAYAEGFSAYSIIRRSFYLW